MAITAKQRRFVEAYADCLNATEAARRAGYAHPMQQGHRLLRKVEIVQALEDILKEQTLPKTEVLSRLTAQARSDMGDFLRVDEEEVTLNWSVFKQPPTKEGAPDVVSAMMILAMSSEVKPTDLILKTETVKRSTARLDILAAGQAGKLGMIKKYSIDKEGKVTIELYDSQAALIKLGEAYGIFRDPIADNLDKLAAVAESLEAKLLPAVGPEPAGAISGEPDAPGEGTSSL